MRIAVIQLAYGDDESPAARTDRAAALVAEQRGHDLVILPELWAQTGFGYAGWSDHAEPLDGPWSRAMRDAARAAGCTLHAGSFVERLAEPGADGKSLSNTSLVLTADGAVAAVYRKIHLFGFSAGEPLLMEPGTDLVITDLPSGSGSPDSLSSRDSLDGEVTTGLSTCYDLRFPELYRAQVDHGATMFLVPAAWPLARVEHWQLLGRARAIENQCVVVQCNTGGTHARTAMGGRSQVVSATGAVLAVADHADETVLSVNVDLTETAAYRDTFPVITDRRL